jgi:hypothetical protein
VKFLRRSEPDTAETAAAAEEVDESVPAAIGKSHTPAKGRATPKRRDAETKRRGPAAPPPRTTREAMKRGRGNKEERKALAAKRREGRVVQRQKMMEGDDRYLPARERGPVKAYLRDQIDSHRSVLGLFMPLAIIVFMSLFFQSVPVLQQYLTLITLLVFVMMIGQAVLTGRKLTSMARAKFPKEDIRGFRVGWYAFSRGVQLRKLRIPKPRVKPGDKVD